MKRFVPTHDWNIIPLLVTCVLLTSCISVPTGTTQVYRKSDVAKPTTPPAKPAAGAVVFDKTLFKNAVDPHLTIRKAGTDKSNADVFAEGSLQNRKINSGLFYSKPLHLAEVVNRGSSTNYNENNNEGDS